MFAIHNQFCAVIPDVLNNKRLQICNIYVMLICMKPSAPEISDLKTRIMERYKAQTLSYAEIGRRAKVDQSQVWRICTGEFRTRSDNVVQVCKVLGVQMETVQIGPGEDDASWRRLEMSLRNLWDKTPKGAKRIIRILDSMADWRTD